MSSKNVTKTVIKGTKGVKGILEHGIETGKSLISNTLSTTSDITSNIGSEIGKSVGEITSKTSSGIDSLFNSGKKVLEKTGHVLSSGVNKASNQVESLPGLAKAVSSGKKAMKTPVNFLDDVESNVVGFFDNIYVSTIIKVILVIYAAYAAPRLSRESAKIFDSTIVRVIIAALIVYIATKDSTIAILIALGFILSLQTAHHYKVIDTSNSVSKNNSLSWLQGNSPNLQNPTKTHSMLHNNNFKSQPLPIETFTSNREKQVLGDSTSMNIMNTNRIPGVNQESTVKKISNTYTTQGLAVARNSKDRVSDGVTGYAPTTNSSAGIEGDSSLGFSPF